MTTQVLDRPLTELPTELFPELEPVARLAGAAGGVQDRSIVVIENPAASGLTGFVLAETFRVSRPRGEVDFFGVSHYRVRTLGGVIIHTESDNYPVVTIKKGHDVMNRLFGYVDARTKTLPQPSTRPYEVCFLTPAEFDMSRSLMGDPSMREEGLSLVYGLVTRKPGIFSRDGNDLVMPADYASLIIGR